MNGAIAVLFVAAAWLASQGVQPADATQPENITITLERTSCFGPCPIYKVTLRGDGSVTYVGEANVRVKGTKSRKIDPEAVRDLAREMERAGFFTLRDHYRTVRRPDGVEIRVSDGPTTFVTLTIGERSKRVEDYFGTPEKLEEIERRIDEVAGTKQWAFVDVPTLRAMAREGWKVEGEEADWVLRRALDYDDTEVLRELLDLGVDPDTKYLSTNTTPLMVARSAKTVGLLLAAGADANAKSDNGGTPLGQAASWLEPEAVRLLLAAGANVDAPSHGRTPLVSAACNGNAGAVELLLGAGAYPWAIDDYGVSARQCATDGRERAAEEAKHPDPFPSFSQGPFEKDFDRVLKLLEDAKTKRKR